MTDETKLIQCVTIQSEGMPPMCGPFEELQDLIECIFGNAMSIDSGTSITVTFSRMTLKELNALPEYE